MRSPQNMFQILSSPTLIYFCMGRIKGDEVSQSAEPLCTARAFKPGSGGEAAGRTSGAGGGYCCFQWI